MTVHTSLTAAPATTDASVADNPRVRTRRWTQLRRPSSIVALSWLVLVSLVVIFAGVFAPHDPLAQDLLHVSAQPSGEHLLGTDSLGRDILSRLIYGGRRTLLGALVAVVVALAVGIPAGLAGGFVRGKSDAVLSWFAEIFMSVPGLILLVAILAVTPYNVVAAMATFGLLGSAPLYRIVRNATLGVAQELYVTAASLSGLSKGAIVRRHIGPRISATLFAQASIMAALAVVVEVGLGLLLLDARPPDASWGNALQDASSTISLTIWPVVPTSLVIGLTVLALGVLGDVDNVTSGARRKSTRRSNRRSTGVTAHAAVTGSDVATERASAHRRPAALLQVSHLDVSVHRESGQTKLVDDVSFSLAAGEIVGLVGESGAGKSITSRAVLGLLPDDIVVDGEIRFEDEELVHASERQRRRLRGKKIAFVSQEPMVSLDPTFRIGKQVEEAVRAHRTVSRRQAKAVALELLETVRINDAATVARKYPHEISGGMAQRVCIAIALAGEPQLLIADEPTTALDVTVQAEILGLLRTLRDERGLAVLLVTHDWGVVADICDRAVVLYAGEVVEQADVEVLFGEPAHPYTRALRAADPHHQERGARLRSIDGTVPPPGTWPVGCRFADRCALATEECRRAPVSLLAAGADHVARCIRIETATHETEERAGA